MHYFFSFKYVLSVLIIYSLLQKRVIARTFKGLFGGTCECKQSWRKAKCNVSTGLIQLKKAKQKVELKGKRTWKWEAGGGCAWGDFTSRKTRRMQIRVLSHSRHNSRWLLELSPKQSIVWVPGYHSFPKWAILYPRSLWDMHVLFDHMHKCFNFWIKVNRFDPSKW